jgi:hypothetical protein
MPFWTPDSEIHNTAFDTALTNTMQHITYCISLVVECIWSYTAGKVRIGRIRHTHTHTHTHRDTHTHRHTRTETHTYKHTHTDARMHTHRHTHTNGSVLSFWMLLVWDVTSFCLVEIHQRSAGIYSPVHGINPDKSTRCHTSKDSLVHSDTNTISHK